MPTPADICTTQTIHADASVHNTCIRLEHSKMWVQWHGLSLSHTEAQADAGFSDGKKRKQKTTSFGINLMMLVSLMLVSLMQV